MHDVFLAGLESDLVNLAFAAKGEQAAASDMCVTPVGKTLGPSASSSYCAA